MFEATADADIDGAENSGLFGEPSAMKSSSSFLKTISPAKDGGGAIMADCRFEPFEPGESLKVFTPLDTDPA